MGFENLIHLFSSNESTRGIVRMNIAEGALLYRYVLKKKNSTIVEIGRKYGGSTALILSALDEGHLHSIDIVEHEKVHENIKGKEDKVTLINKKSRKVDWGDPIGLLFIDGDHSYEGVKNDVDKYTPFVEIGGYVVMHDVVGKKKNLRSIIKGLEKNGWQSVESADSTLVLERIR